MIRVVLYQTTEGALYGFHVSGHAGFAEHGSDIVCAAVSALTIQTANAIEALTETPFTCETSEEEEGSFLFLLPEVLEGRICKDSQLLLRALALGLTDVEREYGTYITLYNEEV